MHHTSSEVDDLDLPPLDGNLEEGTENEKDEEASPHDLDASVISEGGDPYDDATGEQDALEEFVVTGAEEGWLADSDAAHALDLGAFDVVLAEEEELLDDEESNVVSAGDDDLGDELALAHADSGEEGPIAEDEELREEDLPSLDADEEGEVDELRLFDSSVAAEGSKELRWDDRAWARVTVSPGAETVSEDVVGGHDDGDEGGTLLAVRGLDPALEARDATWRSLDETSRITAVALLPGESIVLALEGGLPQSHVRLVRVQRDGEARIIAELQSRPGEGASTVTTLRWDVARGYLLASGVFGEQAFRPAV